MNELFESAALELEADAYVRGEGRRRISLTEFRGSWVVLALGASRPDVLDLAAYEEAFAADGAVVLAGASHDLDAVERWYAHEPVRFPILCDIDEARPLSLIVDPEGVVRYAGGRQSARELLATLETVLYVPLDQRRAA